MWKKLLKWIATNVLPVAAQQIAEKSDRRPGDAPVRVVPIRRRIEVTDGHVKKYGKRDR